MKHRSKTSASSASSTRVLMESEVARQVRQHARSSMKAEVCGVLIGTEHDGVTTIEAAIAGANAAQGGAHVTFTQDTWEHIYQVKDEKYPDRRIVGWYHSHPGFGVFLSEHDLFIHKNFFSGPQQIAWVYDPHSDEEGCFGWRRDEISKLPDVAFRFQQPCGEAGPAVEGEAEAIVVPRQGGVTENQSGFDWMTAARDAAIWFVFLVVGAVGAFYYLTNRAIVLPKVDHALVVIEGDKAAIVPPDLALRMLDILRREMGMPAPDGYPAANPTPQPSAEQKSKGGQDGRK
jgi:proteasome lid subunit RPN8/RPN11